MLMRGKSENLYLCTLTVAPLALYALLTSSLPQEIHFQRWIMSNWVDKTPTKMLFLSLVPPTSQEHTSLSSIVQTG
jgi:hypothetical protein